MNPHAGISLVAAFKPFHQREDCKMIGLLWRKLCLCQHRAVSNWWNYHKTLSKLLLNLNISAYLVLKVKHRLIPCSFPQLNVFIDVLQFCWLLYCSYLCRSYSPTSISQPITEMLAPAAWSCTYSIFN